MTSSVGTKAKKKQSPKPLEATVTPLPDAKSDPAFERALLSLERVCVDLLDGRLNAAENEQERIYLQQRFRNIVTPVSMALMEYKGPRRFHYHYRHRADDETVLHPVLESSTTLMAQVCEYALSQCASKLSGIHDPDFLEMQRMLESSLRTLLMHYYAAEARSLVAQAAEKSA